MCHFTGKNIFVSNILPIIVLTKFQIKRNILFFWTKLTQKGCFRSKKEKMKKIFQFYIFELV